MELAQISAKIKKFLDEEFPGQGAELTEETDLLESYFLDSFGIIDTVMFLESAFGIDIARADISGENFRDIRSIAGFVTKCLGS